MSPAAYRAEHGLAVGHSLQAQELQDKRAVSSRARYEAERVRWFAGRAGLESDEHMARVLASRAESATRPGTQASYEASGGRLQPVLPERIRQEFTGRTRALGYPDIEAMLSATAAVSARVMARLLNVADHHVRYLRRAHGYSSTGHASVEAVAAVPPPRPAKLPTDRLLACLECGDSCTWASTSG